ncbi:hypothetical protein ON010_g17554 [Phytophthora cinnamomi]|nr:hypothetical protein ON010_g17554 [Phytophthora cinnamomi]
MRAASWALSCLICSDFGVAQGSRRLLSVHSLWSYTTVQVSETLHAGATTLLGFFTVRIVTGTGLAGRWCWSSSNHITAVRVALVEDSYSKSPGAEPQTPALQSLHHVGVPAVLVDGRDVSDAVNEHVVESGDGSAVDGADASLACFVGLLLEEVEPLSSLLFLDNASSAGKKMVRCFISRVTGYITAWHLVANVIPNNEMPSVPPRRDEIAMAWHGMACHG